MSEALIQKDEYKTSRFLYVLEAAFECFIATAVGTVYLARVAKAIGIPDALTAVLSSTVSLGFGFQIFAVFLANKKPVKTWVTILHIISQIMFGLIYFVPVFEVNQTFKIVCLFVLLISAEAMHNLINAPKITWYMSLVDNHKRGSFTAVKEMVSLVGNILFTFLLGSVLDMFSNGEEIGKTAFIVIGCVIFGLMILHTITLVFSKEKPDFSPKVSTKENLKSLIKNKPFWKVVVVQAAWSFANGATLYFLGTYQSNELGFTATYSSLIIMVASFMRILASLPMGKIADKYSFKTMLNVCYCIALVDFAVGMFTAPSNGKVLMFIFYILNYVALAGINSSTINLVYDYVDYDKRMSALALSKSIAGICGFMVTIILAPVLSAIQKGGNQIFGMTIYGQQLFAGLSFVIVIGLITYLNIAFRNQKRVDLDQNNTLSPEIIGEEQKGE